MTFKMPWLPVPSDLREVEKTVELLRDLWRSYGNTSFTESALAGTSNARYGGHYWISIENGSIVGCADPVDFVSKGEKLLSFSTFENANLFLPVRDMRKLFTVAGETVYEIVRTGGDRNLYIKRKDGTLGGSSDFYVTSEISDEWVEAGYLQTNGEFMVWINDDYVYIENASVEEIADLIVRNYSAIIEATEL